MVLGAALALVAPAEGLNASAALLPASEELVPNTVARVSEVGDRTGTITRAEFRHQVVLAAVAAGRERVPGPKTPAYEQFARNALQSLLEMVWIRGEAAAWDVVVTHREVKRQLALIKRESFESAAEYRRFLRESRFTRRDIYERVEFGLVAEELRRRLQKRIAREARNPYEERRAWQEFIAEFNERWRERTVCAPAYATERCSNGPPLASS